MLPAWTHRNNVDIHHRSPRARLTTTAHRLAVDARRARRARPQEAELVDDLPLADGLQGDAGVDEVGVRVRAAFAALPGPQRDVLFEVLPRPVGRRNDAHPADPARHREITHFLWVACTAPRPSGSRCGGLAPGGQAVAWPQVGPGPAADPVSQLNRAMSPIRVSSKWRDYR
jgi:hypothetical protein